MVWGHNLQHMAPFGALTSGFCMVFDSPTLICLTLDHTFWSPDPTSWPRKGPGPFWGPKRGPELIPHEVTQDFLRGEWFVWYPGTLWVYRFPPNPSQGRFSEGFPPNPKIQWAPLGPWVGCLLSLCGPVAYCPLVGHAPRFPFRAKPGCWPRFEAQTLVPVFGLQIYSPNLGPRCWAQMLGHRCWAPDFGPQILSPRF